jgi:hypothetical protein
MGRQSKLGSLVFCIYAGLNAIKPLTGQAEGNDVQRDGTFQNEALGCTLTPTQDSRIEILAGPLSVGVF